MSGQQIRIWREQAGMTQDDLAAEIGCSRSTIGFWERGSVRPQLEYCAKLAQVFGFGRTDILREVGHDVSEPVIKPVISDDTTSCRNCPAGRQQECRRISTLGLPLLCESVTQEDVDAAWYSGHFDELVARYEV